MENKCPRCLYCPSCYSKVVPSKSLINDEKTYYYLCQSCKWNSVNVGICEKSAVDLYSKLTLGFQNKANDKFKVYEALLENLRLNQEEIIKREKKEVRQKKKTNLVEEHKGSSAKEKQKYTHEMFNTDQERREKLRQHQMHYLGNSITQEIIDGKLEIKGISKEGIKAGFNDFIGINIFFKL